jgi:hypothetical protein
MFEVDAFKILRDSKTLDEGLNALVKAVDAEEWADPAEVRKTYIEYGEALRAKFKQGLFGEQDIEAIAPFKMEEIQLDKDFATQEEQEVARINEWEKLNKQFVLTTDNRDYLATQTAFINSIDRVAAAKRRKIKGGDASYMEDLFYRFAGSVDALPGIDTGLSESTNPKYDEGYGGAIAQGAGQLVTMLGAGAAATVATGNPVAGVAATVAIGGAMGAEEVYNQYENILAETGNQSSAQRAAAIEAVGQAFQILPTTKIAGKISTGIGKKILKQEVKKETEGWVKRVGADALTEFGTEGVGQGISNVATQSGLGKELNWEDTLRGVPQAAVAGGLVSGVASGVYESSNILSDVKVNRAISDAQAALANKTTGGAFQVPTDAEQALTSQGINPEDQTLQDMGDFIDRIPVVPRIVPVEDEGVPSVQVDPTAQRVEEAANPKSPGERVFNTRRPVFDEEAQAIGEDGRAVPRTKSLGTDLDATMTEAAAIPKETLKPTQESAFEIENEVDSDKVLADTAIDQDNNPIIAPSQETIAEHLNGADKNPMSFVMSVMAANNAEITTQAARPGSYGFNNAGTNTVGFVRSLWRDQGKALRTMAHEFGHWLDYLGKKPRKTQSGEDIVSKLLRVKSKIADLSKQNDALAASARAVSKMWRPGWVDDNSVHGKYRARPTEIFADVMSAFMVRPDLFISKPGRKAQFADLYSAMDLGMSADPQVSKFWNQLNQILTDPTLMDAYRTELDAKNNFRFAKAIKDRQLAEQEQSQLTLKNVRAKATRVYQYAVDAMHSARQLAFSETDPAVKEEKLKFLNDLQANSYLKTLLDHTGRIPRNAALKRAFDAGVRMNDINTYMRADNLVFGDTVTMKNVREDPMSYASVALLFREGGPLAKYAITQETQDAVKEIASQVAQGSVQPELVTKTLARLSLDFAIGDANVSKLDQKRLKEAKTDKERAEIQAGINAKSARRAEREGMSDAEARMRQDIKDENVELEPGTKDRLFEIIKPTAFNTRRYLANNFGNLDTAVDQVESLRNKLTPEQFDIMLDAVKTIHETLATLLPIIESSGVFPAAIMERMKLNKDNYVTNLVLKYWEQDPSIDATVRTALGSLEATGGEAPATIMKMEALATWAYKQNAINDYAKMLESSGIPVRSVDSTNYKIKPEDATSWFYSKEAKDADEFALVTRKNGKPSVVVVKGRQFADAIRTVADVPLIGVAATATKNIVTAIEDINNMLLLRPLYTVNNPAFALSQFRKDRANEAFWAKSFWPTLFGSHTDPELRSMKKRAWSAINKILKGEKLDGADAALAQQLRDFQVINGQELENAMSQEASRPKETWEVFAEKFADEAGMPMTFEKKDRASKRFQEWALNQLAKVPLYGQVMKFSKKFSLQGEQLTKAMGFLIATEKLGMPPQEAANFARERFGTPEGGGLLKKEINAGSLFGRAHLLGLRNMQRMFTEDKTNAVAQIVWRVVLPKLLVTNAIIVPIVAAMFGDDEAKKVEIANNMIPSSDKTNTNPIVTGFWDENGSFKSWGEVKASDIKTSWKVTYLRMPLSRELASVASVLQPFANDLMDSKTDTSTTASNVMSNLYRQTAIQTTPVLQHFMNIAAIAVGDNPYDSFRGKEILSNKDFEGKNLIERLQKYTTKFFLPNQTRTIIGWDPFKENIDAPTTYDQSLKVPGIGPAIKGLFGASNYGLYEIGKKSEAQRVRMDSEIRNGMQESSKEIQQLAARSDSTIKRVGRTWRTDLSREEAVDITLYQRWQAGPYRQALEAARVAYEKQDWQEYDRVMSRLEAVSKLYLAQTARGKRGKAQE